MHETPASHLTPHAELAKQYMLDFYNGSDIVVDALDTLTPIELDGVESYIFGFQYLDTGDAPEGQGTAVVDVSEDGKVKGLGEIFYGKVDGPLEADRAYVAYTATIEPFRQQGLGKRRYKVMNEVSKNQYGSVLHSDPLGDTSPEAARIWQSFVQEGSAERYLGAGGLEGFRFTA